MFPAPLFLNWQFTELEDVAVLPTTTSVESSKRLVSFSVSNLHFSPLNPLIAVSSNVFQNVFIKAPGILLELPKINKHLGWVFFLSCQTSVL